jgi:UDP-N-acetylglucosamine diphosphorylase/glucosamine-1-phosphate N-acetyltransferase
MMVNICIYEDISFTELLPLTLFKPAYELLVGTNTIFEKIDKFFGYGNITIHCREHLKPLIKTKRPGYVINKISTVNTCLFINGRTIFNADFFQILQEIEKKHDWLFVQNGQVLAAYLKGDNLNIMKNLLENLPTNQDIFEQLRPKVVCKEIDNVRIINSLADLISYNAETISEDFKSQNLAGILKGDVNPFVAIYNENNVFIDKGSVIEDFALLNANHGPIYIGKNVFVEAQSRLEGPLYIGDNTKILGGKIIASSIGKNCKVAGEVTNSVFSAFSNKAHAGFIGHSYIGEWVNLGAMTTNSNLKNTYGEVSLEVGNKKIKTGQTFLGSFIGDYVKTAIGTLLNTGTIVGAGSTLFGNKIHDKFIPNFAWGEKGKYVKHDLEKMLQTTEKMMLRRHLAITPFEKELITFIYNKFV